MGTSIFKQEQPIADMREAIRAAEGPEELRALALKAVQHWELAELATQETPADKGGADYAILQQKFDQIQKDLANNQYEYNQELSQLSTLLGAWVQATKGGAHGLLVELLVERTEEVLG